MAQHALGGKYYQRLSPRPERLPSQQMEILRGVRWLADLEVVGRSQLQKALDTRAGMLRTLAFVTVWQQQHQPREQVPLELAGDDELVDDRLRHVSKIAELG